MATQGSKHKHPVSRGRRDSAAAFLPDPSDGPVIVDDDLAEDLAEEYLRSATSAEESFQERLEGEVPEEEGGPFVITSAKEEFAKGTDGSNPRGAEREAFPKPNGGPRRR